MGDDLLDSSKNNQVPGSSFTIATLDVPCEKVTLPRKSILVHDHDRATLPARKKSVMLGEGLRSSIGRGGASEADLGQCPRRSMLSLNGSLKSRKSILSRTSSKPRMSIVYVSNLETILERIGGFGKFQVLSLICLLGMEIPASFVVFIPVFIGAFPKDWFCNGVPIDYSELCGCNGTISSDESTIVTEWSLVCGKEWVPAFINSLQQVASMVGVIVIGQFGDWYGRKNAFVTAVVLMGLGNAVSAVAYDPYSYAVAKIICGSGFTAYLQLTSVYTMEFQIPKWRAVCGAVSPWGEGMMLLAVLAYFIRSWRTLTLITCFPFLLIVLIYPVLPESPRWLLRNRKVRKAHEVLSYIARVNGLEDEISYECVEALSAYESTKDGTVQQFGYRDFFREKSLRNSTICLMLIWASWGVTNYGIAFNIHNVPGNMYLNMGIIGATDAIGIPTSLFLTNRLGRRRALYFFMIFAAVFLVILAVLELVWGLSSNIWVVMSMCFLAKLGISGARGSIRTVTGESYPTAIRIMGACLGGLAGALGTVVAPQLAFLGTNQPFIPYFAFAVISVVGAVISLMLTETAGKALEDNIPHHVEEIELTVPPGTFSYDGI